MVDLLVAARAIHFASTMVAAGVALFQWLVAGPAFRTAGVDATSVDAYRRKLKGILLIALALAVLSGCAWLMALAATIDGQQSPVVLANGTAWLLLTDTRFGHVWLIRLALAALLLWVSLLPKSSVIGTCLRESLPAALAAGLVGSLAWSGHAGAGLGVRGGLHTASDILHLVAGGAWLGGLLPLWLLFGLAIGRGDRYVDLTMHMATRRFSALGLVAVGTLLATGLVNTWALVGCPAALVATDYGRLLLLKIMIFVAMVVLAAINRLRLTPRLPGREPMRWLARNALVENALGLAIIAIVSVLGTLPPALDAGMHGH